MRRASLALMALAGFHAAAITSPVYAQGGVQPVPYGTSQPVPYNPGPAKPAPSTPSAPSTPPSAGTDIIHLKNGGMLRGTIVDAIPGSHARIQLPTGEIAMVQWSEIARIENGARPPTPTPEPPSTAWKPPPPPPPTPGPPPITGPTLLVHIDSPRPVRLEHYDPARSNWDELCNSPCDMQVPVEGDYRIAGVGVKASNRFAMTGKAGDRIVIDVNPASKGWFAAGIVGGGVGLLTISVGLYVVLVGAIGSSIDKGFCSGTSTTGCAASQQTTSSDSIKAAGWTITAVGGVLAAAGVVVMAMHWSTSTAQEVQVPVGSPAAKNDAYRRDAIWNENDIARAMPKQQVYVPLITQSF